jgi:hypothetical protein
MGTEAKLGHIATALITATVLGAHQGNGATVIYMKPRSIAMGSEREAIDIDQLDLQARCGLIVQDWSSSQNRLSMAELVVKHLGGFYIADHLPTGKD